MRVGNIVCNGRVVGTIDISYGENAEIQIDPFVSDTAGYVPQGRASESPQGIEVPRHQPHHGGGAQQHRHGGGHPQPETLEPPRIDAPSGPGRRVQRGTAATDAAIAEASRAHNFDPNFSRAIASIESGMNPSSNAHNSHQYKGLFQVGHEEWSRFGEGNIYSAHDNSAATLRMWDEQRRQFHSRYGRDPTDAEQYMIHQQGMGFFTRGAMTNISGNPYPGMRGPQTHDSFMAGWGREIARRKARFEELSPRPTPEASAAPSDKEEAGP